MPESVKLIFPTISPRIKSEEGEKFIWDSLRGKWLVLTPEEWVRRHVVEYLRRECGFAPQLIVEEHPVTINGMAQRADIVVMGADLKPLMVVECKEPNVKISEEVLRQVTRYNNVLRCRYIALTNGITTYCYEHDGEKYNPINAFPHAK